MTLIWCCTANFNQLIENFPNNFPQEEFTEGIFSDVCDIFDPRMNVISNLFTNGVA